MYVAPEFKIAKINAEDIIATSTQQGGQAGGNVGGDGGMEW